MKFNTKHIAAFLLSCFVLACKKEPLPTEESGVPKFYFKGEVDGVNLNLEAGNNDYFMNASHHQDTTGVYVFSGNLSKDNCDSTCDYAITVLLNDTKVSKVNESINSNNLIRTGEYLFNNENLEPLYYKVELKPLSEFNVSENFTWKLMNSKGDYIKSENYLSEFYLNANEVYKIKLSHKSSTECDTAHTNIYKASTAFQTTITASRDISGFQYAYNFKCETNSPNISKYEWNFGDNTANSILPSPSHSFQPKAFGYYLVRLKLTDTKGDTCISYYQVNANPDKNCHANFIANFSKVPNYRGYSAVTVIVTKPGGEVFSTRYTVQPNSSFFKVLSVDDYDSNKKGEPTKQIKMKLNCVVKSKNNRSLEIKNAEAVMAVSYK
jgi:hypothetical protein